MDSHARLLDRHNYLTFATFVIVGLWLPYLRSQHGEFCEAQSAAAAPGGPSHFLTPLCDRRRAEKQYATPTPPASSGLQEREHAYDDGSVRMREAFSDLKT